jgi:hypothetical protein
MPKKQQPSTNKESWPTKENVRLFDTLFPMIQSDLNEIRELSKKKQDEPLNEFKTNILNKKLEKAKIILKNEPTAEYLELLDNVSLPTNSDAVLQISQFINALKDFKGKYYDHFSEVWGTKD